MPASELNSQDVVDAFQAALRADDPEALYDRAPCGYLSTTPDGTIVKVNQTFLTLTGYQRDDLVGRRTFAELLTGGGRIYHETHFAPLLKMAGSAREIALDLVRTDGGRVPVLVNSVLEHDAAGAPSIIRTAVFDATERRRYERELVEAVRRAEASETQALLLAKTLQSTLIPPAPPAIEGLEVAAAYRPAGTGDEVGGDFYDIFEVRTGTWVVAIGDVLGKGVDAAVVTSLARYTIRAAAVNSAQPSQILATLNHVVLHHATDRFCTVAVAILTRRDVGWTATIAIGGHPPALLVEPGGAPAAVGRPGTLLGVFPDAESFDVEVELVAGAALVLYTDGVTEAKRGVDFFGDDRLAEIVEEQAASASAIVESTVSAVLSFQAGIARDDIAIVTVRVP